MILYIIMYMFYKPFVCSSVRVWLSDCCGVFVFCLVLLLLWLLCCFCFCSVFFGSVMVVFISIKKNA